MSCLFDRGGPGLLIPLLQRFCGIKQVVETLSGVVLKKRRPSPPPKTTVQQRKQEVVRWRLGAKTVVRLGEHGFVRYMILCYGKDYETALFWPKGGDR